MRRSLLAIRLSNGGRGGEVTTEGIGSVFALPARLFQSSSLKTYQVIADQPSSLKLKIRSSGRS